MLRLFRSSPGPASQPSYLDIAHEGRSYRVAVKRVHQARRFTLKVRAATLDAVLTMPARSSLRAARDFAERHAEWIGDRMERLPCRTPFEAGSIIPVRGVEALIVQRDSLRATAWLEPNLEPDGPPMLICVAGKPEQQQRRVLELLRREARKDLDAAVKRHAGALGKSFTRLSIKDTRSRWGSCTAQGALNFSWRLVMAPPHVLDYLAAHEVAHLAHMDHSDAFWAVARRLAPDLERAEGWLKRNGAGLHRFG